MRGARDGASLAGDVLVALHGLTGSPARVLRYVPDLPGVRVVAPVLLGHGAPETGPGPELTLANATAHVLRALTADGVGPGTRVHLVGMSLGATLARTLAARADLDVVSAALVRPTHTDTPRPSHLVGNEIVADLLERDPGTAQARLGELAYLRGLAVDSPSTATNLLAKARTADAATVANRVRLLREGSGWTAPSGPLPEHVRTVVIAAPHDALHPLSVAETWRREVPGELHLVADPADEQHDAQVREQVRTLVEGTAR